MPPTATRSSKRLAAAANKPTSLHENPPTSTTTKKTGAIQPNKPPPPSKAAVTKTKPPKPSKVRARPAAKKQGLKKTGLKTAVEDTSAPLGTIDREAGIQGTIATLVDGEPGDVMLALVEPSQNVDKYFVLQLIEKDSKKKHGTKDVWVVYTRWGRTGTVGQGLAKEFDDLDAATQHFYDKFKEKAGLAWDDRKQPTVAGKYRFVTQDFAQKSIGFTSAKWKYWVDDNVDGKVSVSNFCCVATISALC